MGTAFVLSMGGERTPDVGASGEQCQLNGQGRARAKFCEDFQGAAPTGFFWETMKLAGPTPRPSPGRAQVQPWFQS